MSHQHNARKGFSRAPDFPVGGGELGALIRNFDWSSTSLGPIALWPQSLRTAIDIVLRSPLPLVLLWGRDGVMIYNDAYSGFAGQRHPELLGSKVLEGWAEVADFNAQAMKVGLAGGTLSFRDQQLTLYRNNRAEPVWMDLNFSPVLDESGRPAGVLAIVVETTARVQAEQRNAFMLTLGDHLRELMDEPAIADCAVKLVGEHLGADLAGWAGVDLEAGALTISAVWRADPSEEAPSVGRREAFDPAWAGGLAGERTVRVDQAGDRPVAPRAGPDVRSILTAPVVRDERLAAVLFAHSKSERHWTDVEQLLTRDAAERIWTAMRRARAMAKVRESEARLRALVDATSDVIYRMSPDWRAMRPLGGSGFRANGEGPAIAWVDAYLPPEDQSAVLEAIEQAIREKKPFQFEHRARQADGGIGWTFSRAIPILDDQGEIVEWFGAASDVTGRKQAEQHLRLVINELNHRVKNNLAMIQAISTQTFRNTDDLAQAQASFTARILTLAKANDLLTDEHWVDAALREVILSALQSHLPHGEDRFTIEGPALRLSAKTALSMSMAVHELATNAVKYGAWSNEAGKVFISWTLTPAPGGQALHLEWRERGGPRVSPPQRRGFGSRLVERGLAAELEGEVQLRFEPEGLTCTIDAPMRDEA